MFILPFHSSEATLAGAGGKGLNLARLARAGFSVPPGFIVTTAAYTTFVAANELEPVIQAALAGLSAADAPALEQASARIRAAFAQGKMPAEIEAVLLAAQTPFGETPLAVRSSATAEDLPDLSFAGQQDTYLNVIGAAQCLTAIVNCWSSLWTARAIGYRLGNALTSTEVALAVVIQVMVPSEVAGVLFTANPLTGHRGEMVIDATFGLGEALVSGQVEPDHFVVAAPTGAVLEKKPGAKRVVTRSKTGGGVETIPVEGAGQVTLTEAQLAQLAELGRRVQAEYNAPQDIEWAFAGGQLYLLQARAITSLFPVPQLSFDPLKLWFSFGAVQGLVGPMTPLGRAVILSVPVSLSRTFGLRLQPDEIDVFATAGERLWVRFSDVIRNPIGARIIDGALGFVEPSIGQILRSLADDPRLGVGTGRVKFGTLWRLAGFFRPAVLRLGPALLAPEKARAWFDACIETYLAEAQLAPAPDRFGRLANILTFLRTRVAGVFPFLLPRFVALFGPSMAGMNLLLHLAPEARLALEVTRALPGNVTTAMDLALWRAAATIQTEAEAAREFQAADAAVLAARYRQGALPPAVQAAVARFLEQYGMRGVGEIDLGQLRWREDPTAVMRTLQSYLALDPEFAPDKMYAHGEQAARRAVEKLAGAVRRQPGGWLKEKLVRGAARRVRALMGARESPKFLIIRLMGLARQALLEVGAEFVAAGTLARPDDLTFLTLAELEVLARGEVRDWPALVAERRAAYARELRRRQVPRVLAGDGRAFYAGVGAATDTAADLLGSPVSPGVVEGVVHVVFDPHTTQLAPGEILVCPGTDPAWTPLFLAAGGLITEVGGMMTHGSVVAREYGLPAVVGVDRATQRLHTGQRIRLDGTSGKIVVLAD